MSASVSSLRMRRGTVGEGEQVQIVIAQGHGRGRVQRAHPAQDLERGGAAIHEVADEPQTIPVRGEANGFEQCVEFGVAPLHVADCVERHRS